MSTRDIAVDAKLALVTFKADRAPHITINHIVCDACGLDRICTDICPAQNYSWDAVAKHITVATESCFECGTCRVACTDGAIAWKWPGGGFGVVYVRG